MMGGDEAPHRRLVEMVVVIVRDDDGVDARQVLESEAGSDEAARPGEGHGARAIVPGGIGEDVDAVDLDQECGVSDPGDRRVDPVRAERGTVVRDDLERRSTIGPSLRGPPYQSPGPLEHRIGIGRIQVAEAMIEMMDRDLDFGANGLGARRAAIDDDGERDHETDDQDNATTHGDSLQDNVDRCGAPDNMSTVPCEATFSVEPAALRKVPAKDEEIRDVVVAAFGAGLHAAQDQG